MIFLIRKVQAKGLDAVAEIYSHIHDFEEAGKAEIGWDRAIYPTRAKTFGVFYEDYARKPVASYLRMDTNVHNKNARAMYIKLGYKE